MSLPIPSGQYPDEKKRYHYANAKCKRYVRFSEN